MGHVELSEEKAPRLRLIDSSPTGHSALDQALEVLPAKDGKKLASIVSWRKFCPREGIAASLESAGVIGTGTGGFLGLRTTHPTVDPDRGTRCANAWARFSEAGIRRPMPSSSAGPLMEFRWF